MKYYPIALDVRNKRAIIVGGGRIAERKTLKLIQAGAKVKIVSPTLTVKLRMLLKAGKISWCKTMVREELITSAEMVVAATSDVFVNKNVAKWAKRNGILVNVVDEKDLSSFISPAIFRKDRAIFAVYTDGQDPRLSRDLKDFIKEKWDDFLSYRNRL